MRTLCSTQAHLQAFARYGAQIQDTGPIRFQPRVPAPRLLAPLALLVSCGILGAYLAALIA